MLGLDRVRRILGGRGEDGDDDGGGNGPSSPPGNPKRRRRGNAPPGAADDGREVEDACASSPSAVPPRPRLPAGVTDTDVRRLAQEVRGGGRERVLFSLIGGTFSLTLSLSLHSTQIAARQAAVRSLMERILDQPSQVVRAVETREKREGEGERKKKTRTRCERLREKRTPNLITFPSTLHPLSL